MLSRLVGRTAERGDSVAEEKSGEGGFHLATDVSSEEMNGG
jgi:hypothetical protein